MNANDKLRCERQLATTARKMLQAAGLDASSTNKPLPLLEQGGICPNIERYYLADIDGHDPVLLYQMLQNAMSYWDGHSGNLEFPVPAPAEFCHAMGKSGAAAAALFYLAECRRGHWSNPQRLELLERVSRIPISFFERIYKVVNLHIDAATLAKLHTELQKVKEYAARTDVPHDVGICALLADNVSVASPHLYIAHMASKWNLFSGVFQYPVAVRGIGGTPQMQYNRASDEGRMWDRNTEYGVLRWQLLEFLLELSAPDRAAEHLSDF